MCFLTSFRVLFRVTNRSRISASCRAQFRDDPSSSSGMLFIGSWRTSSCWGQRGPERLGLLETRSWQAARERLGGRSRPCTFVQDYGFVLLCFCAFVLLCFCTFVLLYFRSVLLDFGYRAPCRNGLGRVTFRGVRPDPNHAPANPDPSPCRGCAVYLCPLVGSDLTGPECTEDFTSPPASTLPSTRPGGGNLRGDEPCSRRYIRLAQASFLACQSPQDMSWNLFTTVHWPQPGSTPVSFAVGLGGCPQRPAASAMMNKFARALSRLDVYFRTALMLQT